MFFGLSLSPALCLGRHSWHQQVMIASIIISIYRHQPLFIDHQHPRNHFLNQNETIRVIVALSLECNETNIRDFESSENAVETNVQPALLKTSLKGFFYYLSLKGDHNSFSQSVAFSIAIKSAKR